MSGGLGEGGSPGGPFLTHWGPLASLVFSGPHSSDRQNRGAGGHGHYVSSAALGTCEHACVSACHLAMPSPTSMAQNLCLSNWPLIKDQLEILRPQKNEET